MIAYAQGHPEALENHSTNQLTFLERASIFNRMVELRACHLNSVSLVLGDDVTAGGCFTNSPVASERWAG
ncbi:MAG: hypothetical protein ACREEA_11465 [Stellaceae bacterium]